VERVLPTLIYLSKESAVKLFSSLTKVSWANSTNASALYIVESGSDGLMDEGYTRHSGCPVYEGQSQNFFPVEIN
jgi:hypothetical protein